MSGLGALTIALAALGMLGVAACRRYPRQLILRVLPYIAFVAWVGLSLTWAPPDFGGAQNGLLYLLFGSMVLVAGVSAVRRPSELQELIRRCVRWIDVVLLGIVLVGLIWRGIPSEQSWSWIGPRGLALLALIPLSWHLAGWYYGEKRSLILSILWLAAIAVSLSRTAMAISIVLVGVTGFLQLRFRRRQAAWSVAFFLVSLGAAGGLVEYSNVFQERFFTGDTSIELGGTRINASGRLDIWGIVIESARESPVIGKGIGSSLRALEAPLGGEQPHNDYLRLWHDFGAVGLLLYIVTMGSWMVILLRGWYGTERARDRSAVLELAGALALLGVLLAMITDNVIVYVFVMAPLGVMVGAGLGVSGQRSGLVLQSGLHSSKDISGVRNRILRPDVPS